MLAFWWVLAGVLLGWYLRHFLAKLFLGNDQRKFPLWYLFLGFLAGCALILVFALNDRLRFSCVFAIEVYFFEPKIFSLILGALIGFWANAHRNSVSTRFSQLYLAIVGGGEHSSWALQAGTALLIFLLILASLQPDLLQRFEKLKAGDVEAEFSSVSTINAATREVVNFSVADFYRADSIENWDDFADGYVPDQTCKINDKEDLLIDLEKNDKKFVARRNVIALFGKNVDFEKERMQISCILFRFYFDPIIKIIHCMDILDELENIRKASRFTPTAFNLRRFLVDAHPSFAEALSGKNSAKEDVLKKDLRDFVDQMINLRKSLKETYNGQIKSDQCNKIEMADKEVDEDKRVIVLFQHLKNAYNANKSATTFLELIDPYVPNLVGDMLGFFVGQGEEAKFLSIIKSKYASNLNIIDPGFVSLYYTEANAKLRDEIDWPLDDIIKDLDRALNLDDYIITSSWDKFEQEKDPIKRNAYLDIVRKYVNNKADDESEYQQIYITKALNGARLSDEQKVNWKRHFAILESISNAIDTNISISITELPSAGMDQRNKKIWEGASLEVQKKFDEELFLALGYILLTEKSSRSPPQACAAANYWLVKAENSVSDVAKTHAREDDDDSGSGINEARLKNYTNQFKERISASCL